MSRAPALDALRGLAALAIVVLHVWLYTTTAAEKGDSLGDAVVHQLRLGVPLFFCLSGFLLYRAWVVAVRSRRPLPDVRAYAAKRAWRIVPAYVVVMAGSLLLLAPLEGVRGVDVPDWSLLPLFAIFASNLNPATTGALDPPLWTLAVEVQFYVLLPLLAALALRRRGVRRAGSVWLTVPPVALLVGGTVFNARTASEPGDIVVASSVFALAPCFAAGMLAAVAFDAGWLRGRSATALLLVAGTALVVADGWWHETGTAGVAGRVLRDLPAAVGFAAVVLVAARPRGSGLLLPERPVRVLGELSFPIYLWHMPLMLALRGSGVFPEGHPAAALVAVLAVTMPVAWLSWSVVERPALRYAAHRAMIRASASGADAAPVAPIPPVGLPTPAASSLATASTVRAEPERAAA